MKNNKLESFEEFSAKELDQLDRLNVLDEEKIIGGKKDKCGQEIGTFDGRLDKRDDCDFWYPVHEGSGTSSGEGTSSSMTMASSS